MVMLVGVQGMGDFGWWEMERVTIVFVCVRVRVRGCVRRWRGMDSVEVIVFVCMLGFGWVCMVATGCGTMRLGGWCVGKGNVPGRGGRRGGFGIDVGFGFGGGRRGVVGG